MTIARPRQSGKRRLAAPAAQSSRSPKSSQLALNMLTGRGPRTGGVRKGAFRNIYGAQSLEKIRAIREGVAPAAVDVIAEAMGAPQEVVIRRLGIPKSTWARKRQNDSPLEKSQSELVVGLATLIGQVESMLGEEAGEDAAKWFYKWAQDPVPALGGRRPTELLDTKEGQQVVGTLLSAIEAGTYQ